MSFFAQETTNYERDRTGRAIDKMMCVFHIIGLDHKSLKQRVGHHHH